MSIHKNYGKLTVAAFVAAASMSYAAPLTVSAELSNEFLDVKKGHHGIGAASDHYEAIKSLAASGIVDGYPDGKFYPWKSLTRGQAAKILTAVKDLTAPKDLDGILAFYDDVKEDNEYAKEIAAVTEEGIFQGDPHSRLFKIYESMTREQAATILVRAFDLDKIDTQDKMQMNLDNVSPTHRNNVQIIADLGITTEINNYRPYDKLTRAAFTTLLHRTMKVAAELEKNNQTNLILNKVNQAKSKQELEVALLNLEIYQALELSHQKHVLNKIWDKVSHGQTFELITDLEEFIQNIDPDELEKEETDDKQHESSEDDDQEAEDGSDLEEGDTDREDTGDEIEEEGTEGEENTGAHDKEGDDEPDPEDEDMSDHDDKAYIRHQDQFNQMVDNAETLNGDLSIDLSHYQDKTLLVHTEQTLRLELTGIKQLDSLTVDAENATVIIDENIEVTGITEIKNVDNNSFINHGKLGDVKISDKNGMSFTNAVEPDSLGTIIVASNGVITLDGNVDTVEVIDEAEIIILENANIKLIISKVQGVKVLDESGRAELTVSKDGTINGKTFEQFGVEAEAAKITNGMIVEQDANELILPMVENGYSIAIASSDMEDIISLDGNIVPPLSKVVVNVVFKITKDGTNYAANTVPIPVTVLQSSKGAAEEVLQTAKALIETAEFRELELTEAIDKQRAVKARLEQLNIPNNVLTAVNADGKTIILSIDNVYHKEVSIEPSFKMEGKVSFASDSGVNIFDGDTTENNPFGGFTFELDLSADLGMEKIRDLDQLFISLFKDGQELAENEFAFQRALGRDLDKQTVMASFYLGTGVYDKYNWKRSAYAEDDLDNLGLYIPDEIRVIYQLDDITFEKRLSITNQLELPNSY